MLLKLMNWFYVESQELIRGIFQHYLSIFLWWGIMYIIYIFRTIVLIFVAIFITAFRPLYPSERNKELSSTFQPLEEGRSVQWTKRCDKHGDKGEDNSPKNVNNVYFSIIERF